MDWTKRELIIQTHQFSWNIFKIAILFRHKNAIRHVPRSLQFPSTMCWGSTSVTNLQRLQILQNRAIRNMMKAPRFFRLDNYFLNLRILKVHDLYNFEIAKFMHAHYNSLLPERFSIYFQERSQSHNYNTRSSSNRNYSTLIWRTSRDQRSIKFYGPKIWNQTPLHIKLESKIKFKKIVQRFNFISILAQTTSFVFIKRMILCLFHR